MPGVRNGGWFKMPSLPKVEYELGRALAEEYGVFTVNGTTNWTELFTILLRLAYEVHSSNPMHLVNVIDAYRTNPGEERHYEL
jgi:hypothetical protein